MILCQGCDQSNTEESNWCVNCGMNLISKEDKKEWISGAYSETDTAGRRLRDIESRIMHTGIALGPGDNGNQIQLDQDHPIDDRDEYPYISSKYISIVGGTGAGQARLIYGYEESTRIVTVDRDWRIIPDKTSEYNIWSDKYGQLHDTPPEMEFIPTIDVCQGGGLSNEGLSTVTNHVFDKDLWKLSVRKGKPPRSARSVPLRDHMVPRKLPKKKHQFGVTGEDCSVALGTESSWLSVLFWLTITSVILIIWDVIL